MKEFLLREWRLDDVSDLAEAANNPKIAQNLRNIFPCPYTTDDAEEFINYCISIRDESQLLRAVVVDGKAAGSISVSVKDDVYEKSAELGYWLKEEYWGQGIMTRAVRMICREAFEKFDIVRIFAQPYDYNAGSIGVLENAGFTYEGTMRSGIFKNGQIYSYRMYSILREELTH